MPRKKELPKIAEEQPQDQIEEFILSPTPKLINTFIKKLKNAKSKIAVTHLCKKEMLLSAHKYPNLNSRHWHYTKYRNVIRKKFQDGSIQIHALKTLKLSKEEAEERKLNMSKSLDEKTTNVATFDLREFVSTCRNILRHSNEPLVIAIALMGVTGRRPIEILKTGRFEPHDSKSIIFSGQAKTKGRVGAKNKYLIPVIDNPLIITKSIEFIRASFPDIKKMNNVKIDGIYGRTIRDKSLLLFKDIVKGDHISINNRSLRSMYVSSLYELNNMANKMSFNSFASQVLGHSEYDKNTANSYTYFTVKRERVEEDYKYKDLLMK